MTRRQSKDVEKVLESDDKKAEKYGKRFCI